MDVDFKSKDEIYERVRRIVCKSEYVLCFSNFVW